MRFSVYVDLPHALDMAQRGAITDALEALVPDGGSAGEFVRGREEVYFCVEAATEADARGQAAAIAAEALRRAGVKADFSVTLAPTPP